MKKLHFQSKLLVGIILIMSMLLINASMVKADDATSEYYERLMILQKPAAEASEVVYQYFLKAGIPEEFSGLWVEDTSLIIALTELGDNKTTFYFKSLPSNFAAGLRIAFRVWKSLFKRLPGFFILLIL